MRVKSVESRQGVLEPEGPFDKEQVHLGKNKKLYFRKDVHLWKLFQN